MEYKRTPAPSPVAVVSPRCLSRHEAAAYLSVSADQIDRMIQSGRLPIVRLPVVRSRVNNTGQSGVNRRILIDVRDIDKLIERSKETME